MENNKQSSRQRFLNWLENGADPLDIEMESALAEPEDASAAPEYDELASRAEARPLFSRLRFASARAYGAVQTAAAVIVCTGLFLSLLFAVTRMPVFGAADTLENSELTAFYAERALEETGAVNIVTSIVLSYRGFDTLGESHVLFAAVCTVLLMLRVQGDKSGGLTEAQLAAEANDRRYEPHNDVILQTAARVIVPLAFVLGIYVVFNGHLSPGGGFAGGAIIGAGVILYLMAYGYQSTERFFTARTYRTLSFCALCFYTCSKGYHFITGANGWPSFITPGTPGALLSGGLLLPLNIAVGTVVACTMYTLYTMFRKGDF